MNITVPTFPPPTPAKICWMFYPGNSVCFNTTHLTTISTDGRTARPAEGAKSSSQRLGNSRFPTQSLPDSPSSPRASQQQLMGAALGNRDDPGSRLLTDLGRQDRELLSRPPTALV